MWEYLKWAWEGCEDSPDTYRIWCESMPDDVREMFETEVKDWAESDPAKDHEVFTVVGGCFTKDWIPPKPTPAKWRRYAKGMLEMDCDTDS
jgi:hypothetical protein